MKNYWAIGKILVEAQGGIENKNYGNTLIKKWSVKYTNAYGSGYSYANMARFRQFYLTFPVFAPVERMSWTNIKILLPIKDENKRNYYFNLCIEKNLSKRQLIEEIKSNSYESLIDKPEHIELIILKDRYSFTSEMKNPIIIKVDKNKIIKNEKDLELTILSEIAFILNQLGSGYAFIDSQVKLDKYYIDILLFNYKFNAFVVVELKLRKLKVEDKAQTEMYMKLVDENLKEIHHSKTVGIIISKEQDGYVANFVRNERLVPLTYILENKS